MKIFKKNNLDEMQEQKLLKIESKGCWIAFWTLFIVYMGQMMMGFDFKSYAGEMICFMVLAVYLSIECKKNGIWDRHLQPDKKTNLIVSLIGALVGGVIVAGRCYVGFGMIGGSIAAGLFMAVLLFVLLIVVLSANAASYKKKALAEEKKMDEEEEE